MDQAIVKTNIIQNPFSKNDKSLLIKLMKHYFHSMYSTVAISLIQASMLPPPNDAACPFFH